MIMKKPLYVIAGPTAIGKTSLSIELAQRLNGEIISADSMQVYKYMNIGTAKISSSQMQGIPHHLIDIIEPTSPFHVFDFKRIATTACQEIYDRGKVPIVVGGTGFYIQALLYDIDFSANGEDKIIREELQRIADTKGPEYLHKELETIDPLSASIIHANNVKRVIRAIEFFRQTGESITTHNEIQRSNDSPYDYYYFVLTDNRDQIYKRIDSRVDDMIKAGLEDEIIQLIKMGCTKDMTSMKGIGYSQMLPYIDGLYSLDEAIRLIKRDSRHFAKRQLTWFNRENNIHWIDREIFSNTISQVDYILNTVKEKF